MADTGGDDAHQHLASLRRLDIDLDDLQRLVRSESDGSTGLDHESSPERYESAE
jgi:hypothetical protein